MTTGASPISAEVMDFLRICFSATVIEGYGMTETACTICMTAPGDTSSGHVGGPLACCEVKLADIPEMSYTTADRPHPRGEVPCQHASYAGQSSVYAWSHQAATSVCWAVIERADEARACVLQGCDVALVHEYTLIRAPSTLHVSFSVWCELKRQCLRRADLRAWADGVPGLL